MLKNIEMGEGGGEVIRRVRWDKADNYTSPQTFSIEVFLFVGFATLGTNFNWFH